MIFIDFVDGQDHKQDREMLGAVCPTPSCWGVVRDLIWYHMASSSSGGRPTGKKLTHKPGKDKRAEWTSTGGAASTSTSREDTSNAKTTSGSGGRGKNKKRAVSQRRSSSGIDNDYPGYKCMNQIITQFLTDKF